MNKKRVDILNVISVILVILFFIMIYKGYDKMTNYKNLEYSIEKENVYVGGDAYNYIINGTHATAYFVLGTGFLVTGVLCFVGGSIISLIDKKKDEEKKEDKLPEL